MNFQIIRTALKRISLFQWILLVLVSPPLWFGLHCALISWDGFTDTFSTTDPSDAAVILGNAVVDDETPGDVLESRLKRALEMFEIGAARNLICSGGKGLNNLCEADVMRNWLMAHGVDPAKIFVDYEGKDSYCTARATKAIFDANGWKSALIVTNTTHISRCKLAFRHFGIASIRSAHAIFQQYTYDTYMHEFLGYYYYVLRRD